MYSTHFSKHSCFLHSWFENSNNRKRSPNTYTGKNSFGPLLMSNYTAQPEKHYLKVFPEKETCDMSLDPRPKKRSSACQEKKNQDLGGKRSYTQNHTFTEWGWRLLPEQTTHRRENQRSALYSFITTFLSNKIN